DGSVAGRHRKCSQLGGLSKSNKHLSCFLVEGHRKIASIPGRPGCHLLSRDAINNHDRFVSWIIHKNPIANLIDLETFRMRLELYVLSFDLARSVYRCQSTVSVSNYNLASHSIDSHIIRVPTQR